MSIIRTAQNSRFYYPDGNPCFEIPKKRGEGMKSPTIADARELGLLPSVTTILKVLDRPNLNDWKATQACMAVLTSPRKEGEDLDAFVTRILQVEKVQEQEAKAAADKGSAIHDAIQLALTGQKFPVELNVYVQAVLPIVHSLGSVVWTEKVLVGDGYAGRADVLVESDRNIVLPDFKSTSKIPKDSYTEHKLQTSAYAKCLGNTADRHVLTANIYISTSNPGEASISIQEDWITTFNCGFLPILRYWQWANGVTL